MSYSIAANTRLAGSSQGNFLDDLTNRTSFLTSWSTSPRCCNTYPRILANVGQWPKTQAIKKISNIVVYTGDIVDSVRITYDVENSGVVSPVTVQHGGNGGTPTLTFDIGGNILSFGVQFLFTPGIALITADEKLVAVYGTRLVDASPYGDRKYVPRIYLHHFFYK